MTSFKDCFLIKLVPYLHKVPFDKFKVLFRNKSDVGDGYDDSSDDNSSDGGLEINESSDNPSSDDFEVDRYLDFWFKKKNEIVLSTMQDSYRRCRSTNKIY